MALILTTIGFIVAFCSIFIPFNRFVYVFFAGALIMLAGMIWMCCDLAAAAKSLDVKTKTTNVLGRDKYDVFVSDKTHTVIFVVDKANILQISTSEYFKHQKTSTIVRTHTTLNNGTGYDSYLLIF